MYVYRLLYYVTSLYTALRCSSVVADCECLFDGGMREGLGVESVGCDVAWVHEMIESDRVFSRSVINRRVYRHTQTCTHAHTHTHTHTHTHMHKLTFSTDP